ncbi:MAG: TRAP transporter small permease [Betaproteobacteria bacterium]
MKSFEKALMASNRWALIVVLAAMSIIIFVNVISRYIEGEALPWAEEVARHLMIWLTFLGAGPVLRYGGHLAVENLQDSLPRPLAMALRLIVALLLLCFFGFMIWYGLLYVSRTQYQTTAATQISFGYIYAAMPIGGLLLIAHFLLIVRDYVRDRKFASDAHFDAQASASL